MKVIILGLLQVVQLFGVPKNGENGKILQKNGQNGKILQKYKKIKFF